MRIVAGLEVDGEDPFDGAPHLDLLSSHVVVHVRAERHPEVGTHQVDDRLAERRGVLREALQRVQAGQAHGRLVRTELVCGLRVQVGDAALTRVVAGVLR